MRPPPRVATSTRGPVSAPPRQGRSEVEAVTSGRGARRGAAGGAGRRALRATAGGAEGRGGRSVAQPGRRGRRGRGASQQLGRGPRLGASERAEQLIWFS